MTLDHTTVATAHKPEPVQRETRHAWTDCPVSQFNVASIHLPALPCLVLGPSPCRPERIEYLTGYPRIFTGKEPISSSRLRAVHVGAAPIDTWPLLTLRQRSSHPTCPDGSAESPTRTLFRTMTTKCSQETRDKVTIPLCDYCNNVPLTSLRDFRHPSIDTASRIGPSQIGGFGTFKLVVAETQQPRLPQVMHLEDCTFF